MKIKRFIDRLISGPGSAFGQLGLWLLLAVTAFLFLYAIRLFSNNLEVSFENMVLQFINPASYFPDAPPEEYGLANKWLSLITGFMGLVVMAGLFIPLVSNIIFRRVEKIQNGQISYYLKNHYVVIGFNEMTSSIVLQLINDDKKNKIKRDIVIQTAQNIQEVRGKLEIELGKEYSRRLVFIHGAGNSQQDIKKLYVNNARRIIVLGDDNSEALDASNMKCLEQIIASLTDTGKKNKVECDVLFEDQSSYAIFQKMNFDKNWNDKIYFRPFNFYETWAQKVIVHNKIAISGYQEIDYTPIDGKMGLQFDSGKNVHFVIMGMNKMAFALGIEAARTMHFPNFIRDNNLKTHITFVDPDADRHMNYFISRYPQLFDLVDFDYTDTAKDGFKGEDITEYKNKNLEFNDFLDVRFSFVKGDYESLNIKKFISSWVDDTSAVLTIAVCNDDSAECMSAGLFLPPVVFEKEIPVYIQQREISCLFTEMANKENKYKRYRNVRPFGMVNECFSIDDIKEVERNAKLVMWVYDTYHSYRSPQDKGGKGYSFDAALQKVKEGCIDSEEALNERWQKLAVAKRWSNINNAFSSGVKNRSFDIHGKEITKNNLELLAKVEHNRWNVERLIFGYRATTKEENVIIKKDYNNKNIYRDEEFAHCDIRPYENLDYDSSGIKTDEYDICISACLSKIIKQG